MNDIEPVKIWRESPLPPGEGRARRFVPRSGEGKDETARILPSPGLRPSSPGGRGCPRPSGYPLDIDLAAVSNRHPVMDAEHFFSNAISILATPADLPVTADKLARLAAVELADFCAVFMFENDQTIRRLAIARRTALKSGIQESDTLYALDLHAAAGPAHVLRTGQSEMFTSITPEIAEGLGLKREELPAAAHSLCLCVPIVARGVTIGAIALLSASKKAFNDAELSLITNLANAAGIAIDHAKSHRQAEEANRLKDEFVAMVSHELRTPLTPMLGCIHLLRTANLTQANFDRALDTIEKYAHVQVQIVEDLLDASRIVSGKLHLVMKSTQIVAVVEEALASIRPSADSKELQIITNFQDVQQPIDGDPHRLQQIVRNLLSNAVKFTPANGRIEIAIQPDGDHVQIQVIDTGIGIPADVLPSIFERFRKSTDSNNSKVRSGLGLGLAIVRHLVELHNGSIEAASAGPGLGAVFTLRFPFAARKAATATS